MRIIPILLLATSIGHPARVRAQGEPGDREYAVWSALIDTFLVGPRVTRIVVDDTTVRGARVPALGWMAERAGTAGTDGAFSLELRDAFIAANLAQWPVDAARIHARLPAQLRSRAQYEGPTKAHDPAWGRMRDGGFPGSSGQVSLARVGFSADGRTALAFVSVYCGGKCASETYFVLRQSADGRWVVVRSYLASVS